MRRLLLLSGVLAPAVYVATVIIGGWITPGYDHLAQPVSALFETGALHAAPISAAFVAYNLLLLAFGLLLAFAPDCKSHPALRLGAAMILLNGLFGLVIELAPMDAQGTPATVPGSIHIVLAGLLAITCMAAMAAMAWGWHRSAQRPAFKRVTTCLLVIMLVSGALAAVAASQDWPLTGLYQRLTIGSYLVWIAALAILQRRPSHI